MIPPGLYRFFPSFFTEYFFPYLCIVIKRTKGLNIMKDIYEHNKEVFMGITVKNIADYLNRRSPEFLQVSNLGALEVCKDIIKVSVIKNNITHGRKTDKINYLNMRYCIGKPDEKKFGEYYVFEVSKKFKINAVLNPVEMIEFLSCKRTKDEIIEHIISLSGIRVFIYEPLGPPFLRRKMLVRTVVCDEVFDVEKEIVLRNHNILSIEAEINKLSSKLKDEKVKMREAQARHTMLTKRKVTF